MGYEDRITPEVIEKLKQNEIFVFGSNSSGRHGKGAAKTAMGWGARYGQGFGLQGRTFGIPTVNAGITNKLSLQTIEKHINEFIQFAKENPRMIFLTTKIGCGLAGWREKDIAPLFKEAINVPNIFLPKSFWKILTRNNEDDKILENPGQGK